MKKKTSTVVTIFVILVGLGILDSINKGKKEDKKEVIKEETWSSTLPEVIFTDVTTTEEVIRYIETTPVETTDTEKVDDTSNNDEPGWVDQLGSIPSNALIIDADSDESAYQMIESALIDGVQYVYCNREIDFGWDDICSIPYGGFWVDTVYCPVTYCDSANGQFLCKRFQFDYYPISDSEFEEMKNRIDNAVQGIIDLIPVNADDWQKMRIVHDELVKMVRYDHTLSLPHIFDPYGALVNHDAVCSGYASAFKLIMDRLGFDSKVVTSDPRADDAVGHGWNKVTVDQNDYYIDVTWDDIDYYDQYNKPIIMYDYFGLTKVEIEAVASHLVDHEGFRGAPGGGYAVNFHEHEGYLADKSSASEITEILSKQKVNGNATYYIRFTNAGDYADFVSIVESDSIWSLFQQAGIEAEKIYRICNETLYTVTFVLGDITQE